MTYKEFLNIVTFEEVAPHIVNMYPEAKDCLGWFKLHYDMLKQMTPKRHDDSNGDVCHITMKDWDDGTGPHLDAFPMEGDLWEHSLTKEIVLDADVHVTDAEIVACCLWPTSFYGFTKGQKKEFANIDFKSKVKELKTIILNNGGYVPSKRELLPFKKQEIIEDTKKNVWYGDKNVNKTKRKRLFRRHSWRLIMKEWKPLAVSSCKSYRHYRSKLTVLHLINSANCSFPADLPPSPFNHTLMERLMQPAIW